MYCIYLYQVVSRYDMTWLNYMFMWQTKILGKIPVDIYYLYLLVRSWPHEVCEFLGRTHGKVFFGFDNFLIAYAGRLIQPAEYMSVMFWSIFMVACFGSTALAIASPSFQDEVKQVFQASRMQRIWIVSSGTLIALAQTSACLGFRLDEVDSGPLQSVVIANVPIVGIFFYFWSHETLSKIQLLGCALIMAGISFMFLDDAGPVDSNFPASFLWICISTLFYASSIITIRFAGGEELPERPKSIAIVLSSGLLGFLLLRLFLCSGPFTFHPEILIWAMLNALASMTGLLMVVLSYEVPDAKVALATALIDSNAVPMCVLNFLLLGEKPGLAKLVGMAVVLLGCSAGFASPHEAKFDEILSNSLLETS